MSEAAARFSSQALGDPAGPGRYLSISEGRGQGAGRAPGPA